LLTLCIVVFSPLAVLADEVVLKNGDRLSGRVVEQTDERIVIETLYAGEVKIAAGFIEKVVREEATEAEVVPVAQKTDAEADSGKPAAAPKPAERLIGGRYLGIAEGWKGDASVGFSYTSGNSKNTTMSTALRAVKTGGIDKLTVYVRSLWNKNRQLETNTTTSHAYWGGARYDRNFDGKMFGFGSYDFESDRPKHLNFRSVAGGGVGNHVIKSDKTEFDVLVGGAWNHTWQTGSNTDTPEAIAGNSLKYRFNDRLRVQNNFTYYQNVTDHTEYRYILDTTFSIDVTKKIGWFVTLGNRFNNDPIGTSEKNDFLFTTGVKWNYGRKK
jgi:putative salt-induced outer membrane protein YdiY